MMSRILIVDDESNVRFILSCLLRDHGYDVHSAVDGLDALDKVRDLDPDIVLLDLEMPNMGGLEALKELVARDFGGKVIIVTAFGTIPSAVRAMKIGAFDYLTKPFDNDELLIVIEKALEHGHIEQELATARDRLEAKFSIEGIVTANPQMRKIFETVRRVAPTDNPVLISGESGTGKELIANAVHQHSRRKSNPFVPLNCGAIPEHLVESELFGFKRGAFSSADRTKTGLVEKADRGTLFLDEIGELGLDAQVKLLRFTQSGEFYPVGSTTAGKVDVRIVAASNRDIESAVAEGRLRTDLFYRLNVVRIAIPPLRARREDIPLLAEHFLKLHKPLGVAGPPVRLTARALRVLQRHDWPGNVRELENVIRCALAVAEGATIDADMLPELSAVPLPPEVEIREDMPLREALATRTEAVERAVLMQALERCAGNKSRAARLLGICRNTLKKKLARFGMR